MNKFDLMNKVWTSNLTSTQKNLLCYLISKSDTQEWRSWPTTARLAQVAGVKHEKNFKLLDYLEGFVTVDKVGRQNHYILNTPAIKGVTEGTVVLKNTASRRNTPAMEGVNTPATADNTPATAENTPAGAGTDSTSNTTRESSEETTTAPGVADAPPAGHNKAKTSLSFVTTIPEPSLIQKDVQPSLCSEGQNVAENGGEKMNKHTPSVAGVSHTAVKASPITALGDLANPKAFAFILKEELTLRQKALLAAKERAAQWSHPAMAGAGDSDEWL